MSRENVDRLQAAIKAVGVEGPEAILGLLDPEIEWIADRSDMGRVTYRGHEGVKRSFEDLAEGFEEFGFEAEKLIEAGSDIVAVGHMYGRGRSTGIRAEIPLGIVFSFGTDGKLVRYQSFRDPETALEAAGVTE